METTPQENKKDTQRFFKPLIVDGLAAVSSLAVGAVTAWREILAESYSAFTGLDIINPIKKKYRHEFGPQMHEKISDIIAMPASPIKSEAQNHVAKEIYERHSAYNREVEQFFRESKYGSYNWEGFKNRISLLNNHDRWKIGLTAMALSGVALGSVLLLSREIFKGQPAQPQKDTPPAPASFVQKQQEREAKDSTPSLSA